MMEPSLVVPTERNLVTAGRYPVRSAEGRQEIIKRSFVRDIDGRELEVRFDFVAAEHVIDPYANVEQISRRDAWRVVIGIESAGSRNRDSGGTVSARARRDRAAQTRVTVSTVEANRRLLIRR